MKSAKQNKDLSKHNPDPVYSSDIGESEVVRSILTEYIRENLPDNLV